jgi:hypothetical protein
MSKKEKRPSILNREMPDMHEDGVHFNKEVLKKREADRNAKNHPEPEEREGGQTDIDKLPS